MRNLSSAPAPDVMTKTLVADLVQCPTLGAPAKETQANPLLDNFEGMTVTGTFGRDDYGVTLISDDNFSARQTTGCLISRSGYRASDHVLAFGPGAQLPHMILGF